MERWAYVNSVFVKDESAVLQVRDLAIQRGYGVFDFFRVRNGKPVFLKDHLQRLRCSANSLRLGLPSAEEMENIIIELIRRNGIVHSGIRITVTGGVSADNITPGKPSIVLTVHDLALPGKESFNRGIRLMTHEYQRQLPTVKSIDYLMAIWLVPVLDEKGMDETLYHSAGRITECPRSNFFAVMKNGDILTPASGVLEGITRKKILQSGAGSFGIKEQDIFLKDLERIAEAFITSTTKGILPISRIDAYEFPVPGPITIKLRDACSQWLCE
jgi:D-alanine transaminase/branched-chain amino acid aminotransferase